MARWKYVQDGDEYYLVDMDNPGVLRAGPVSGEITINNPETGTTVRNFKTAEEIAEDAPPAPPV